MNQGRDRQILKACSHSQNHTRIVSFRFTLVMGCASFHPLQRYGPAENGVMRRYLCDILEGLRFLHDNATAHRDVKPANVLISDRGVAKLSDFGARYW